MNAERTDAVTEQAREVWLSSVVNLVRRDPRYLVASFLTFILIIGQLWLSFLESFGQFALAVVFSLLTEVTLSRLFRREWPNPISAYMTGVSLGILVRSPALWPYPVASILAISQKYAIQIGDRHLFNPSNFGLCLLLLAVPETVVALSKQWTNNPGVMIFIFLLGFLVIARLRRLHLVFTYVGGFVLLSILRSYLTGVPVIAEVAQAIGPPFQLFIFFMITDPRTSPLTTRGRVAYAVSIAVIEGALRLMRNQNAAFFALFVISPIAVLWEELSRRSARKS